MVKKRHKPPSRKRYEERNPNWTARLPVELKDEITAYLENSRQSRRVFMAISLGKQKADYQNAYNQGYNEGHNAGYERGKIEGHNSGMNDWAIWVYCWKCLKPVFIKPNSDAHKKLIEVAGGYMEHSQCNE